MRVDAERRGHVHPSVSEGPEGQRQQELKGILLMLAVTVIVSFAQVAFKVGDGSLAGLVWIGGGLAAYGATLFLTLSAYGLGRVSVLYPITALSFIIGAVAGVWLFGESMSKVQVLGLVLILGGTILLGTDTPRAGSLQSPQNTGGGEL